LSGFASSVSLLSHFSSILCDLLWIFIHF
jgi:hypothetical protein